MLAEVLTLNGQWPNKACEAYTGKHADHRGGRTPRSLMQPRQKRQCGWRQFHGTGSRNKGIVKSPARLALALGVGEIPEGPSGSSQGVVCMQRSIGNLGGPANSRTRSGVPVRFRVGMSSRKGETADGSRGVGLPHSTLRTGEPSTWGRG